MSVWDKLAKKMKPTFPNSPWNKLTRSEWKELSDANPDLGLGGQESVDNFNQFIASHPKYESFQQPPDVTHELYMQKMHKKLTENPRYNIYEDNILPTPVNIPELIPSNIRDHINPRDIKIGPQDNKFERERGSQRPIAHANYPSFEDLSKTLNNLPPEEDKPPGPTVNVPAQSPWGMLQGQDMDPYTVG